MPNKSGQFPKSQSGTRSPERQRYLDAKARELGYRNYAELEAWEIRRRRAREGANSQQSLDTSSWWNAAKTLHPAGMIERVSRMLDAINENNRQR